MKASEFLHEQDDVLQNLASDPIPLETAKGEFEKKAAEFEYSGISVNDIKIGTEGTTITLQQGNATSMVTFVWGAEEDIGPFAAVKSQQGESVNLDLTPLSPPVVDTASGRQIDISNLSWLNQEAFAGIMSACGFKDVPPEQEEEPKPGEGSGAATPTGQQPQSPATELDAKTVPAPKPQGQPGEALMERAIALGLAPKKVSSDWLKEEDSYTVTVQKGKDTFNVTVGGTSDADAKKKAKELTKADKVMNASKQDKKKEMESKDEKIHSKRRCPKCQASYVGKECPVCGNKRLKKESVDQKVDTQMKCKACGYIGAEPSFKKDEVKKYEYTCPKCDSHDVMDAPSEVNHSRMRVKPNDVEEEFGDKQCQDCGFKGSEDEFSHEHYGEEDELVCPECGGKNIECIEEENMDNQPIGLFRFVIREGKRIKIPLGEKKKAKQPHKVVSQKPYTFKWDKKVKEAENVVKCSDCGHSDSISNFDYDKDAEELYCPECGSTNVTGVDESKGKKASGQGQKVVNAPKFGKQTWKRPTKEGLGEGEVSKSFFIKIANELKRLPEQISKQDLIDLMVRVFQAENPRFDADRFKAFIVK